ncbi:MAG: TRAP transporter substrate-binding protein DctP [Dehalococcoidales bacterium]|nr:TRAP transporter substrate-binding protein DctP [Syntrophales bacterium]MDX9803396.1 TRAP transporter substrate-binding protein DctP [Dehalococcoidales bacterium]
MKRRYLNLALIAILAFSSIVLLAGFSDQAFAEKTYKFRLQHWQPTASATYQLFMSDKGFPAMVHRASGGRITIETYPVGGVVPVMDQVRSVGRGIVEMGAGCPAYQAQLGSYWSLLYGIPFTLASMEDVDVVWRQRGLFEYASELYAKHNVHLIGYHHESPISLFSKKPITKVEDFKGLKVRAVGTYGDFYTQLGAAALSTPGSEIYVALDRGLADACTWGSESAMVEIGLAEVTKYMVVPWISGGTIGDMYMNKDAWDSLPEDLQQIMISCMQDWGVLIGTFYRSESLKAREMAQEKYGMQLSLLPPSELKKLEIEAQKLLDKYEKQSPEAERIVQIYKEYMSLKDN